MKFLYAVSLQQENGSVQIVNAIAQNLKAAIDKAVAANANTTAIGASMIAKVDLE